MSDLYGFLLYMYLMVSGFIFVVPIIIMSGASVSPDSDELLTWVSVVFFWPLYLLKYLIIGIGYVLLTTFKKIFLQI